MKLEGKAVIITGATGGIGKATAKLFLDQGAQVMLVGRSDDKLASLKKEFSEYSDAAYFKADAADEDATRKSVESTVEKFGGLDILIANAGAEGVIKPLNEQTAPEFENVLRTNVLGVWMSMKYCVDPMRKRGSGSIVALSSIAGVIGFPNMMPYIASKHAVFGMVKTAALELAESNIRVNAIGPGPIANRMIQSIESQMAPGGPENVHEMLLDLIPMKRYGTNEEVAKLALFLASEDSSFCTGAIHLIDGGFTAA